ALFGGNSNWRGPIWFPTNYLLVEALQRYDHFYTDKLQVEVAGKRVRLSQAADDLQERLVKLFLPGKKGRPAHGDHARYHDDPHWKDLVLFYEFFHGDTGRGCGASHQTGWTALVSQCIENLCRERGKVAGGQVHGVRLTSAAV
ncbi:MAG: hypothetical protein AAGK78_12965, partial [Planctomycetota bacterium]